eukprot:CAMPEP_0168790930 /NCGR_PEP_ID=MMETSP0725-20121227/13689_1 /TAXON_ID=265536 /ORGANISM="Amphiprora sp., Strain CCMP467" /LENGTH=266 /DNA_ID=CAMNT_0008841421 /DNA_START=25 /DNA_END=821 /DNA_ORIENTATION=-
MRMMKSLRLALSGWLLLQTQSATAFLSSSPSSLPLSWRQQQEERLFDRPCALFVTSDHQTNEEEDRRRPQTAATNRRRQVFQQSALLAITTLLKTSGAAAEEENMYAPAFVQSYSDFTPTKDGYSYRDVNPGKEGTVRAEMGDRVVFDWSGYTIGYFGRPFQAKGGPQGGAFDKDLDYARTVLGSGDFVKGLEMGLAGMRPGGVRQIVVPYGALSYPTNDMSHERVGPKPSTFSGQRALNFVLENPRVDRTLLFNVKVIRVDKPNG